MEASSGERHPVAPDTADGTPAALPEGIGRTGVGASTAGLLRRIYPKSKDARRRDLGTEECHPFGSYLADDLLIGPGRNPS
jgi:hypothetical protein